MHDRFSQLGEETAARCNSSLKLVRWTRTFWLPALMQGEMHEVWFWRMMVMMIMMIIYDHAIVMWFCSIECCSHAGCLQYKRPANLYIGTYDPEPNSAMNKQFNFSTFDTTKLSLVEPRWTYLAWIFTQPPSCTKVAPGSHVKGRLSCLVRTSWCQGACGIDGSWWFEG